MTFDEIMSILKDRSRTDYQIAADLHALISKATAPSALNIKAKVERAKRGPNKPKATQVVVSDPIMNGHDDHADH